MGLIWNEKLSVNVKELDEQHKQFLGILNQLYDSLAAGTIENKVKDILDQLVSYAEMHFATEEKYFDLYHYEEAEEHKEEHFKLKAQVDAFLKEYPLQGTEIIYKLIDFLEDWLIDHLEKKDKKYTKCFNDHGLF